MPSATAIAVASSLVAASAASGGSAYAALWPRSQLFGKVIVAGSDPHHVALTYDDGPNDVATERLLEVLARYNVRATFFMIGRFVQLRPQIARAVLAAGHVIGNHTMTHPWLAWQSAARIRSELADTNAVLQDTLGAPVRLFRPPHGARRPLVLRTAAELGLAPVQWNVNTRDWKTPTAAGILNNIQRGIGHNRRRRRASNVLMHDGGDQALGQPRLPTVEATAALLDLCQSSSTKFVTPDVWLNR